MTIGTSAATGIGTGTIVIRLRLMETDSVEFDADRVLQLSRFEDWLRRDRDRCRGDCRTRVGTGS